MPTASKGLHGLGAHQCRQVSSIYYELQAACPKELFFSGLSFDDIIERADKCLENRSEQQKKEAVAAQAAHVARFSQEIASFLQPSQGNHDKRSWCESGGQTQGSNGMLTLAGLTVAQEGASCCWRIRLGSLVTRSSQQPRWQPLDPGWEEWRERQRLIPG
ncbi:hypothetical protein QJQ45_021532 [Haematococcus lacustris]|nr:hypothetical protein QJQ45_021532 [Haematococcus lacustris]